MQLMPRHTIEDETEMSFPKPHLLRPTVSLERGNWIVNYELTPAIYFEKCTITYHTSAGNEYLAYCN